MFFAISPEKGVYEKGIFITDELEEGKEIDQILEKHQKIYLSLVGDIFEERIIEPETEQEIHRAIFYGNENYRGQIQMNIQDGKVHVLYGFAAVSYFPE